MFTKKVFKICLIVLLIVNYIILDILVFYKLDKGAFVYILDVGQGDSILIKTIDGKYILVDSGPDKSSLYELQKIIPFWHKYIDVVILTHPDLDHIGGMPYILDYYDVGRVFLNRVEHFNYPYKETLAIIDSLDILTSRIDSDTNFQIGCCSYINVLWPTSDYLREFEENNIDDVNSISTALVFSYNDFLLYLGGDLEYEYEEMIFEENKYDLDVIKVGHHGSSTSTSLKFLELTNPELAVISVGKDNKFRHPTEQVLNYLHSQEIDIKRTDQLGTIEIDCKNFKKML